MIPYCHALPWTIDKPEFAQVEHGPERDAVLELIVSVDEYMRESGIDGEEMLFRLTYGLPTMPPAPGEKDGRPRISLPHARAWLFMFSGVVESLGGNGLAKRIAHEAQRLRGYPGGGEQLDEGMGMEASP